MQPEYNTKLIYHIQSQYVIKKLFSLEQKSFKIWVRLVKYSMPLYVEVILNILTESEQKTKFGKTILQKDIIEV